MSKKEIKMPAADRSRHNLGVLARRARLQGGLEAEALKSAQFNHSMGRFERVREIRATSDRRRVAQ